MAHLDTELLKPTDVARRLGVSRSWVYDAAKAGRIPCLRLGGPDGPLRFLPTDVEEWLEEARRAWLPGASAVRTTLRAAQTASANGAEMRLDGLAANVQAVARAGSADQTEGTRVP